MENLIKPEGEDVTHKKSNIIQDVGKRILQRMREQRMREQRIKEQKKEEEKEEEKSLAKLKNKKKETHISVESIESFYKTGSRNENDSENKIREQIICSFKNELEPLYVCNEKWQSIYKNFHNAISKLCPVPYEKIDIKQKAGRNYNYDFDILFLDSSNNEICCKKIEFKYNAETISDTPQFVSPMKPSQYLKQSFEEYHYSKYLVPLLEKYNFQVPDLKTYIKEVHGNEPKCLAEPQALYYQGCKRSSQYTGSERALAFYKECNNVSKESIQTFISNTELDIEKLNQYLISGQDSKIYLMCKNGNFKTQESNSDDYIIESYKKEKNRYVAKSKSNKNVRILLRWKNGNSIAYPAFQIS